MVQFNKMDVLITTLVLLKYWYAFIDFTGTIMRSCSQTVNYGTILHAAQQFQIRKSMDPVYGKYKYKNLQKKHQHRGKWLIHVPKHSKDN